MVNQRKWIAPAHARSDIILRGRLYSSTSITPKATCIYVKCLSTNPQDLRYPCLEDLISGGTIQPYTHDVIVQIPLGRRRSAFFRIFFKRHVSLSLNHQLGMRGDVVVMRVASKNIYSVVNMRSSDDRYVDLELRRRLVPLLKRFQNARRVGLPRVVFN